MNTWQKIVVGSIVGLTLWATWMFRFEVVIGTPGGQGIHPIAYVLDRWTGAAHILAPTFRRELQSEQPSGFWQKFDQEQPKK